MIERLFERVGATCMKGAERERHTAVATIEVTEDEALLRSRIERIPPRVQLAELALD